MFNYHDQTLVLSFLGGSAEPFNWLIWNDEIQSFEDSLQSIAETRDHAGGRELPLKYLPHAE